MFSAYSNVDLLILNAGVVFLPFTLTEDGFESHFQINYLGMVPCCMLIVQIICIFFTIYLVLAGHFLLTRLLVSRMCSTPGARVISMTSQAHFAADICLHDLNLQINYSARRAYGQSKLALLLMTQYLGMMLKGISSKYLQKIFLVLVPILLVQFPA